MTQLLMKILITDDHAVLRRGLKQILEDGFGKVQFGEKPPEEYADSAVKVMDL